VLDLSRAPDRNIHSVAATVEPDALLLEGLSAEGKRRLLFIAAIDKCSNSAEVAIVATKGPLEASTALFGQSGSDIGNSFLVARILHTAMFLLRAGGIGAIVNAPFDNRVRRLYETMGFTNGEHLDLTDVDSTTKAFTYVARIYRARATEAKQKPNLGIPPLPLL